MLFGRFQRRTTRRTRQAGYVLIVLMIMVTLLAMTAIMSAPNMANQIKRDREEEMVHRGVQYSRAIKKFYKKFGRYPVSIEQLQNTNNIRFLRQRYKDPITGKDFRLLHFGEVQLTQKAPNLASGPGVTPNAAGPLSPTSGLGTALAAANTASQTSPFPGSDAQNPKSGATDQSGSTNTNSQGSSGDTSGGLGSGATGPTFGGGPIIGVTSTSTKVSLKEFNEKNHYNEWQFIYDPAADRGGLITGPYVPAQAGLGGLVPGATPASGGVTPNGLNPGGMPAMPGMTGQPLGSGATQSPQQSHQPQ